MLTAEVQILFAKQMLHILYIDSLADGNYKHTSRYNAKWHLDGRLPIQSFQQPIQHLYLNTTFSTFVDFISILATMKKTSETFNGHP
jgi:hypothetical protein